MKCSECKTQRLHMRRLFLYRFRGEWMFNAGKWFINFGPWMLTWIS